MHTAHLPSSETMPFAIFKADIVYMLFYSAPQALLTLGFFFLFLPLSELWWFIMSLAPERLAKPGISFFILLADWI